MRTDEERSERLRSVDLVSRLDRVALARLAGYMVPIAFVAATTTCSRHTGCRSSWVSCARGSTHVKDW